MRRVHTTIVAVEKEWLLHNLCVCVFVALGIQYAMRIRHIVICGLPRSKIFFPHFLINGSIFRKKKVTEHNMCILIFSTAVVWNISYSKKKWERYIKKCILIFM